MGTISRKKQIPKLNLSVTPIADHIKADLTDEVAVLDALGEAEVLHRKTGVPGQRFKTISSVNHKITPRQKRGVIEDFFVLSGPSVLDQATALPGQYVRPF
ncbi:MAG: hypothetical protein HN969_05335 [Verrucomicrobia bacterium]|nr:hypothetical protein [Verrucomicrobiota bacterium]MBT3914229.1 hypothetical protein [Verrucomicrobiota bacterium]MBT7026974.1 hypothetical protein [Verrucomicrobiota bacterium]MBT7911173.1 hypothetical protein [Verrucomicrobiota bacterium]